jgi:hypothetical protein
MHHVIIYIKAEASGVIGVSGVSGVSGVIELFNTGF